MSLQLSNAEWKVMNALWQKYPATTRDLLQRLSPDPGWAYTTLKTMLMRLAEKGAVQISKQGNATAFTPLISKNAARRQALQSLVNKAFDGAFSPMVQFLIDTKSLSASERTQLAKLLEQAQQEPKGDDDDARAAE